VSADRTTNLGNPGFRSTSQTTANEHENNAVRTPLDSISFQFLYSQIMENSDDGNLARNQVIVR